MHKGEYAKEAERRRERCHTVNHSRHMTTLLASGFSFRRMTKRLQGILGSPRLLIISKCAQTQWSSQPSVRVSAKQTPSIANLERRLAPSSLSGLLRRDLDARIPLSRSSPQMALRPLETEVLKTTSVVVWMD